MKPVMIVSIFLLIASGCSSVLLTDSASDDPVVLSVHVPLDQRSDLEIGHVKIQYFVHESGRVYDERYVNERGHTAIRSCNLTNEQLQRAINIAASLPESTVELPKDRTVLVACHTTIGKRELVYDRLQLPAQMKELFEILGGVRFELTEKIKFNLEP